MTDWLAIGRLFITSGACMFLNTAASHAGAQYCERTNYSTREIADAVNHSPLTSELKETSCSLGGLGRFESGGNKGVYNGSCCTGIFQLNNQNIRNYAGMTREQFGCQSLQFQVDTWARLTNDGYHSDVVRRLMAMGTFDGREVDASFIAACIQLGTGNCQQMLRSGRCGGFADSNGTTICDMARNAKANAGPNCQNGSNNLDCVPDASGGVFASNSASGATGALPLPSASVQPAVAASDVVVLASQI